ncbi:hypothetical protein M8818_005529 [Zalaria obscura]|uniref:Uncharacterized protein n=1 Tax=Zalaria obscura TaxID=2024903 RepID=A0ACC3S873_9PEZI
MKPISGRLIYNEARRVFRDLNAFVRIQTPWPDAPDHVFREGYVPIIVKGPKAGSFKNHVLNISIDAPGHYELDGSEEKFVIHVDDMGKFCRSWMYSDLSHPPLNPHLRLTLTFRDPYTPEYEEKRIPRALQQKLLSSFWQVKNLRDVVVEGDPKPYPTLVKEMREAMDVPHRSPEKCLLEATELKDKGNKLLTSGNYAGALELYRQAWLAMHVVIVGHERHIHGEAFFNRQLTEPPWKDQHGGNVRLTLRIILVANTVLAYLNMENWAEAKFWGMRTIKIMRTSLGLSEEDGGNPEEEAMTSFPAAATLGKIYYRTALAWKGLDDKSEARRLLRVAAIYLPNDEKVQQEIAACALRLG